MMSGEWRPTSRLLDSDEPELLSSDDDRTDRQQISPDVSRRHRMVSERSEAGEDDFILFKSDVCDFCAFWIQFNFVLRDPEQTWRGLDTFPHPKVHSQVILWLTWGVKFYILRIYWWRRFILSVQDQRTHHQTPDWQKTFWKQRGRCQRAKNVVITTEKSSLPKPHDQTSCGSTSEICFSTQSEHRR